MLGETSSGAPENRLQPVLPSAEVRLELERVLEADTSLLGEVWRRLQAGETAEQIQAARGASMPNFVWTYRRMIDALLTGDLPSAPTVALGCARRFRSLLRSTAFSPQTEEMLRTNLAILEVSAANEVARSLEDKEAKEATQRAEAQAIPGIYVYSLPHYLRHPYDEQANRTLFKVGHSNRSAIQRFRQQTRTTALPEDPVLLRIYPTTDDDAVAKESLFHGLLEAADHDRSTARTGGTEWFLTSLRFLDQIAASVGLEARRVGEQLEAPDL
ncbi:MAG: hypothetical protein WD646_00270 [Actinomycetota bacterium]